MPPAKRAKAWDYFEVSLEDQSLANCKICFRPIKRGGNKKVSFCTTNLMRHLKASHNIDCKDLKNAPIPVLASTEYNKHPGGSTANSAIAITSENIIFEDNEVSLQQYRDQSSMESSVVCNCGLKDILMEKDTQIRELKRQLDHEVAKYVEYVLNVKKQEFQYKTSILRQREEIEKIKKHNKELKTLINVLMNKRNEGENHILEASDLISKSDVLELGVNDNHLLKECASSETLLPTFLNEESHRNLSIHQKGGKVKTEIPESHVSVVTSLQNVPLELPCVLSEFQNCESSEETFLLPTCDDVTEEANSRDVAANSEESTDFARKKIKIEPLDIVEDDMMEYQYSDFSNTDNNQSYSVDNDKYGFEGDIFENGNYSGDSDATSVTKLNQNCSESSEDKPHKCNECNYCTKYSSALVIHQRRHTGEKPFRCKTCSFASNDRSVVRRHEQTHASSKSFECEVCGRAFHRHYDFRQHQLQKHLGQKLYKCEHCRYSCTSNNDLKKHLLTHTGEKPFKCNLCNYASRTKGDLVVHNRNHTGERPFKCSYCESAFKKKNDLTKHEKRHEIAINT